MVLREKNESKGKNNIFLLQSSFKNLSNILEKKEQLIEGQCESKE